MTYPLKFFGDQIKARKKIFLSIILMLLGVNLGISKHSDIALVFQLIKLSLAIYLMGLGLVILIREFRTIFGAPIIIADERSISIYGILGFKVIAWSQIKLVEFKNIRVRSANRNLLIFHYSHKSTSVNLDDLSLSPERVIEELNQIKSFSILYGQPNKIQSESQPEGHYAAIANNFKSPTKPSLLKRLLVRLGASLIILTLVTIAGIFLAVGAKKTKPQWKAIIKPNLVNTLCQYHDERIQIQSCFRISNGDCKIMAEKAVTGCFAEVDSKLPQQINLGNKKSMSLVTACALRHIFSDNVQIMENTSECQNARKATTGF